MKENRPRMFSLAIAAALMITLISQASAGALYNITQLDVLNGHQGSAAYGINNGGQVVGVSSTAGDNPFMGTYRAVVWQNGVPTALPLLSGCLKSRAYAINSAGKIVGNCVDSSSGHALPTLWSGGTVTGLGALADSPYDWGTAYGINASDNIAGTSGTSNGLGTIVYWDGGPPIHAASSDTHNAFGYSINDCGTLVGQYLPSSEYHACMCKGGVLTDLGKPLVTSSASDINNSGKIVGFSYFSGTVSWHAAMWVAGVAKDLGSLGGNRSEAQAINNDNQVVGDYSVPGTGTYHAFLWDNNVMTDLNTLIPPNTGWTLEFANDINDKGWIVGYGEIGGITRGFLLTPVPEPATLCLTALGVLALVGRRACRKSM